MFDVYEAAQDAAAIAAIVRKRHHDWYAGRKGMYEDGTRTRRSKARDKALQQARRYRPVIIETEE